MNKMKNTDDFNKNTIQEFTPQARTWAEIDTNALCHNISYVRRTLSRTSKLLAVVKADAYGHGAVQCAQIFLENGADWLGVATVEEARQIRDAGIKAPILMLGFSDSGLFSYFISHNIRPAIFSFLQAKEFSDEAVRQNKKAPFHIKMDTGMHRIGYDENSGFVKEISEIFQLPGIIPEGVFTHFAVADEINPVSDEYTLAQFTRFQDMLSSLAAEGMRFPIRHVCNSAALFRFPQMHLDMVRPGIVLYGMNPGECKIPELIPAMSFKTKLVQLRNLSAGETVSYGRRYCASEDHLTGTIPVGYADGYSRGLTNIGEVLVKGQRAKLIGTICMDQCMVNLSCIENPALYDEVTLFGTQKNAGKKTQIPIDELAEKLQTIHYELTCVVGKRVPRVYTKDR